MNRKNKRLRFFANKIHKEIFFLVFAASLIPTLLCCTALFYLIFNITADQLAIPEAIAYTLMPAARKVIYILSITTPVCIISILILAHRIAHRIIGPMDRIERELFECIKGNKEDNINLRKGDKFWPLVNKINMLLYHWRNNNRP